MTKNYDIDHEREAALKEFVEVWSDGMLHNDVGPSLNCGEAEALADVLDALGPLGAGDSLREAHSWGDSDPEDQHHHLFLKASESS